MGNNKETILKKINFDLEVLKEKKRIVVWGLGEYAEKIVVFSDLLKYSELIFVDSRRTGLFVGKPIIKPDLVSWEEIDSVVVLSYYKTDTIESILKNKYGYTGVIVKPGIGGNVQEFFKYYSQADLLVSDEVERILSVNKTLKNMAEGKKCFVLGNGPSLKQCDLSRIDKSKSIVFSVNEFFRTNLDVDIDNYVVADPLYFNEKEAKDFVEEFFEGLKRYVEKKNVKLWFPIVYKSFIEKKMLNYNNISYFSYTSKLSNKIINEIDLSRNIPSRYSVIHYCIQIALYLGVKSIYLLGCEETGIFGILNNYIDEGYDEHVYEITDNQKKYFNNYVNNYIPVEKMLDGFSNIFHGYKIMNELCEANKVKLYTCADKTLVKGVAYLPFDRAIEQ